MPEWAEIVIGVTLLFSMFIGVGGAAYFLARGSPLRGWLSIGLSWASMIGLFLCMEYFS